MLSSFPLNHFFTLLTFLIIPLFPRYIYRIPSQKMNDQSFNNAQKYIQHIEIHHRVNSRRELLRSDEKDKEGFLMVNYLVTFFIIIMSGIIIFSKMH